MLKRQNGQGMVEFALISPVLLLTILAIIETALIFQGYLTVQHAAREAARWAVTYNPERGKELNGDSCDGTSCDPNESEGAYWARRVRLIKLVAVEKAVGLRIDEARLGLTATDFDEHAGTPNFFGVQVWGYPSFDTPSGGWTDNDLIDHPGLPGLPVRVRVTHNVELLDPLYRAIVPRVRVVAQAEMINEGTQAGYGNVAPPALPPPPPLPSPDWEIGITDTPVPEGWLSPTPETPEDTPTPTQTSTPTPTSTPTATPSGPFIALSDYQVIPTQVILIDVAQHTPDTTYQLRFLDSGFRQIAVISDTVTMDADGFRRGIRYTIPPVVEGTYYVETDEARSAQIYVIPPPPDLVVRSISFPDLVLPNEEITVTVVVQNQSAGSVSGFFDVDLYIDPDYPPVTNRPGNSKQWINGIGPLRTKVVTHVVTLYGGGMHEVWAQVDTSDWVPDELDENNNIFGPVSVSAASDECSDASDRFERPQLAAKWSTVEWNAPVHNQTIEEIDGNGTLTIETSGTRIGRTSESATFLYQSFSGDFVATLKINWPPSTASWAKIGLMMRTGLSANSAMVAVSKTNSNGVQFLARPSAGEDADNFSSNASSGLPVWVRLVRMGDAVSAFYSSDGSSWSEADGENLDNLPETVFVGIAAASYSGGTATGNVDDFEICPIDGDADTCQAYSDDFEPDSTVVWSDADIGDTLAGSSSKNGGTMTVYGDGASLWGSDNFHYTYQTVSGNFVATIRINSGPTIAEWSKAGLMVRGSVAQDSAQVMAVKTRDHGVQFGVRGDDGDSNARFADETNSGTLPVWVQIARNGNAFSAYTSNNGTSWTYRGSTTANMPDDVLIGMAVSSYSGSRLGSANFDDFLFCAGEAGSVEPPIIPPDIKPPGLKECVQTIELGNFEASSITPPWERNVDAYHASDHTHSGNFALEFRASVGPRPEYKHLRPWAYQAVSVPGDVLATTEGTLSYWQYVIPDPEEAPPDPNDHFYLAVRDSDGVTVTSNIPLAHGDTNTPVFQQQVVSVENNLPGNGFLDLAGSDVQLYFYGVHNGVTPGTSFYMDDVRFDICTTQPIPDDIPGTASIGGLIEVLLHARPTKMPGIQVWAFAPGGGLYSTRTIHNSTYHFYNLPPDTYTIYAEVWTDGILYTATTEARVVADERNYGVDLLLQ
jgi:regulation of enolase protein 1 (concanavalin A-like superfamily)